MSKAGTGLSPRAAKWLVVSGVVVVLAIIGAAAGNGDSGGSAPATTGAAATTNGATVTTNNTPLTTDPSTLAQFESDVTSNDPGSSFSSWTTADLDAEGQMGCDLLASGVSQDQSASTLLADDQSGQDPMTSDEANEMVQYAGQDICPDY
jgi:hypothetical protein